MRKAAVATTIDCLLQLKQHYKYDTPPWVGRVRQNLA